MKRILIISLFLLLFCFSQKDSSFSEVKKQKLISLTPATTEILFSLGLDDEIVGVTTFCNYPKEALSKEKVGTFSQPDFEKIISLKPSIIFVTGLEQNHIVEKLKQLKLNVCVSDPSNLQELFDSIEEISNLTHREKEAIIVINKMKAKIEEIKNKVKGIPEDKIPKVFIEIWHSPLMSAGKGSFIDELIYLAGGINIAHNTPRPYSYFSAEQVIQENPDCIILGYMSGETANNIESRLGWGEIKAIKNNRIYNNINPDLFLRPGPRLVEGLEEIYNRIHSQ